MIGNTLLTIGLMAGLFTFIMYYFSVKGYKNTLIPARIGFHVTSISVIAASALLLHAVLTHQYQYKYIFNYSGSDLPVGLLMSTFYAGQEGSLLLWLLFTVIVGLILLDYTSKRGDLEPRVMITFTLGTVFLLVMVSPLLKSPFEYIWAEETFLNVKYLNPSFLSMSFLQGHMFSDPNSGDNFVRMSGELLASMKGAGIGIDQFILQGKGLNPLLQNFWMQIHPPILFVGFAMATAPFAFAVGALIKNDYSDWVKQSLPWLLSGMMVLGLAIMLGGYWAYGVLGWGGYWGWDPVENSSLVPWIIGVAGIHTMLVQKKSQSKGGPGRFVKTNLILAVLTYVLVIYSTFLTRSGILSDASVHSFVAPGKIVFVFLLGFLLMFLFLGLGFIAYRWKYLTENFEAEQNVLSRELALFTGAVTLIASAIIILWGTSAPIWGTAVEIRYYNELNLPIGIIIGLLNGFSLLLKWRKTDSGSLLKSSAFSAAAATVLTVSSVLIGSMYDIMLIIFTWSTAFALFVNIEVAYKIIKGNKLYLGAYVAHTGLALFLLGVIATGGFTEDKQVQLVKGETVEVLGHEVTFTGYRPIENGKKYAFDIEVVDGGSKSTVAPVMYIAEFNNSLMREPDIMNTLIRDFYIAPVSYEDGSAPASGGEKHSLTKGETITYNGYTIAFEEFNFDQEAMADMMAGKQFQIGAVLRISQGDKNESIELFMISDGQTREFTSAHLHEFELDFQLLSLDASGVVELMIEDGTHGKQQSENVKQEVLSIEASVKPFINLVWLGVIVMVVGFTVSTVRRLRESVA
ncbi:MAG: cytochrome c assembly protein [Melioribacteraceae bacterium]|nr:MAG: cytochrome c assembly protein [Melioribacteraceae bacterium]